MHLSASAAEPGRADEDAERFFENSVRPVLVDRCVRCHGADKQSGGLRVDSREALLKGGDSGPAIVPGEPERSRMIHAVRRVGDVEMPPDAQLAKFEIQTLTAWVKQGAVWPKGTALATDTIQKKAGTHWAFQPVRDPVVPKIEDGKDARTPVDAFVLQKLKRAGLSRSPEADRRTLIRRASYTLTGLPPSPDDVARFVNDPDPAAYERLIDRLLDSPHYGEHWGRHWLDVARYSDTKGYVYAREERFWVHAWAYRDWVVRALNDDLPYNRFLLLQLAADQVEDRAQADLAAMGFLTLGRRFLGVRHDIIDDRIDVVTRGMLGLTVGCARCHDHKYDPIPTADYYSLHGVFDSSRERVVGLNTQPAGDESYRKELQTRREKLKAKTAASRKESSDRVRARIGDYLRAQTELEKYPPKGFDQVFEKSDLLSAFVRRFEAFLHAAERYNDPRFLHWHAYFNLPSDEFAKRSAAATEQLRTSNPPANAIVAAAFSNPPKSFDEVIERYAKIFTMIDARWKAERKAAEAKQEPAPSGLDDAASEQLRHVLYGPGAPAEVPDEPIVHTESLFDSATCVELWKLQAEVDRWRINSGLEVPHALILEDRATPVGPRILRRGNAANLGDDVPRRFLSLLAGENQQPFQHGSGRLELARAIVDPSNPLTARVVVNRVWTHHFGRGLVHTPSDFGLRAGDPSHPELLDWLTSRFIADGWSLKKLHRRILLSATFRQSSAGPDDLELRSRADRMDPKNRLLWRMNPHRLTFEELRDTILTVSGRLDLEPGGRPVKLFDRPFPARRTLYGLVDRQFLPGTLRVFDFANPDLHIARRNETTVPQQALFFLNHPMILDETRTFVERTGENILPEARVRIMFQTALQRNPTNRELAESLEFIHTAQHAQPIAKSPGVDHWTYGYGKLDESTERVTGFTPLPHFTGNAWQGGPKWPDAKLGWAQLTAVGGHPGNNRAHAAVRRWTVPRTTTIRIETKFIHEPAAGDGVRAFIVSSRAGRLQSAAVHQKTLDLNVEAFDVEAGETIDFVVDVGDVLNSDQYLWRAKIVEHADDQDAAVWDSERDFTPGDVDKLTPWEQLTHVLLCSNEFLFVD